MKIAPYNHHDWLLSPELLVLSKQSVSGDWSRRGYEIKRMLTRGVRVSRREESLPLPRSIEQAF